MRDIHIRKQDERSNTDVLGYIQKILPSLSRKQSKVAEAILTYPRLFVEKPIEELAPWIGVSAPTITRFCRSAGCSGLRDMKLKVMGAMRIGARYLDITSSPTIFESMREQAVMRAQNGIADAMRVPEKLIEQAIEKLLAARVIYAFGSGGVSNWLCEELQNRLFRIGLTVVPCHDGVMQSMLAATARRGDVILSCSLGGNNRAGMEAIGIAQEYGGYCIALCPPGTEMEALVDLALPVETLDNGDVLAPTSSRYAMLLTIDMIAFGAAIRTRSASTEALRRIKQQFVSHFNSDGMRPLSD